MLDKAFSGSLSSVHAHGESMKGKVITIVGLFVLLGLLLLGLAYLQSNAMNSVRSYVRGEGLWAKAQKDAAFYLQSYARTSADGDYRLYLDALEVPLGDKAARLMLQSDEPDIERIVVALRAGMNHPDDIPGLIRFFLYFQHFPYMRDAIAVWTRADQLIVELQRLGERIRHARMAGDPARLNELLTQLDQLNWRLADLENEFSLVLGEGARWVKQTVMLLSLALVAGLMIPVLRITRRIIVDIEKTEKELRVSEKRFRSLYESNLLGILDWHGDGRVLDANDAFLEMLGYDQQDLAAGRVNWRALTPEDGRERDARALAEIGETGSCRPFEKEFFHKDGQRVQVFLGAALLDGDHERGICFVIDHSERRRAETQLRLAATVFDASSEGIMITDQHLRILAINKAFCKMSGYPESDLLGQSPQPLRSGLMSEDFYRQMTATLSEKGCWRGDVMDRKRNGEILPARLSINAVSDADGAVSHYVAIYTDISEQKAAEDQLRKLAHHDFLTGLPNRNLLSDRIAQAVKGARRRDARFAVLFFDLDRFKPVNDAYGHEVGDRLLQGIAERLGGILRDHDTLARLGGDEFVLLVEELRDREGAGEVAAKVVSTINSPFDINGHRIEVGCSVGISLFPEDGQDVFDLVHRADQAMYEAKSTGSNRYCYFDGITGPAEQPSG